MWVFTTKGFVSVVTDHRGGMRVRGRVKKDLDALRPYFEGAEKIEIEPGKDYRYKFRVPDREAFAAGMAQLAREINYSNFKASVKDKKRAGVLHAVWGVVSRLQPGGPYGYGTRAGYPAVPKGEAKLVDAARAARPPQSSLTGWSAYVGQSPRREERATCVDCGASLVGDEIEWLGPNAYCADLDQCSANRGR